MKEYKIYSLEQFDLDIKEYFTKFEIFKLKKLYVELSLNGNLVGKPLTYNFLREKRINEKRIYFLIYEDLTIILLVAISNKKNQQKTINKIKKLLLKIKKYVYDNLI